MHRIDTEGAVPDGNGTGRAGFRDRNILDGTPGTHVDADWLNGVQESLCRVIERAGMTLEKANHEQLHQAMRLLFIASAGRVKTVTDDTTLVITDDLATVRFDGVGTATLTLPELTSAHAGWSVTISNESASPYVGLWVAPLARVGLCPSETLVLRWGGDAWQMVRRTRTAQPGQTSFWEGPAAPFGWAVRDAAAIAVADYPALLAALYCGDANNATAATGYRYSNPADPAGSRSITGAYLRLADMRGEFERALDLGRGIDAGRVAGSAQAGQNALHTHTGTTLAAGVHAHKVAEASSMPGPGDYASGDDYTGTVHAYSDTSSAGEHAHAFTTDPAGGEEPRPRNVAHIPIRRMI